MADWTEFAPILQMPEMVELLLDNRGIDSSEAEDITGRHYPDHERLPPDRYSPEDWWIATETRFWRTWLYPVTQFF